MPPFALDMAAEEPPAMPGRTASPPPAEAPVHYQQPAPVPLANLHPGGFPEGRAVARLPRAHPNPPDLSPTPPTPWENSPPIATRVARRTGAPDGLARAARQHPGLGILGPHGRRRQAGAIPQDGHGGARDRHPEALQGARGQPRGLLQKRLENQPGAGVPVPRLRHRFDTPRGLSPRSLARTPVPLAQAVRILERRRHPRHRPPGLPRGRSPGRRRPAHALVPSAGKVAGQQRAHHLDLCRPRVGRARPPGRRVPCQPRHGHRRGPQGRPTRRRQARRPAQEEGRAAPVLGRRLGRGRGGLPRRRGRGPRRGGAPLRHGRCAAHAAAAPSEEDRGATRRRAQGEQGRRARELAREAGHVHVAGAAARLGPQRGARDGARGRRERERQRRRAAPFGGEPDRVDGEGELGGAHGTLGGAADPEVGRRDRGRGRGATRRSHLGAVLPAAAAAGPVGRRAQRELRRIELRQARLRAAAAQAGDAVQRRRQDWQAQLRGPRGRLPHALRKLRPDLLLLGRDPLRPAAAAALRELAEHGRILAHQPGRSGPAGREAVATGRRAAAVLRTAAAAAGRVQPDHVPAAPRALPRTQGHGPPLPSLPAAASHALPRPFGGRPERVAGRRAARGGLPRLGLQPRAAPAAPGKVPLPQPPPAPRPRVRAPARAPAARRARVPPLRQPAQARVPAPDPAVPLPLAHVARAPRERLPARFAAAHPRPQPRPAAAGAHPRRLGLFAAPAPAGGPHDPGRPGFRRSHAADERQGHLRGRRRRGGAGADGGGRG
ncbi:hypothetical protein DFJ74DRAFT_648621 [Hyaloraphidium curvatum]|nr:hypothetical protein DFJ74DRAFT_648621 [Hyaloraphidium curvatum]